MTRIFSLFAVFLISTSCSSPAESSRQKVLSDLAPVTDTTTVALGSEDTAGLSLPKTKAFDTTFVLREKNEDFYHAIYIEKNRKSEFYQWLTDFSFDEYDKKSYEMNYKSIVKENSGKLKKFKHADLPTEWLPLYSYKGKYYLYAPSDWGNAGKTIITDSFLIYQYMDGFYPMPLSSLVKIRRNKYIITTFTPKYMESNSGKLIINIIDINNKIAVWEYPMKDKEHRYELYVSKENASNYDMIVNYCDGMKQAEFAFDKINYKKLLRIK